MPLSKRSHEKLRIYNKKKFMKNSNRSEIGRLIYSTTSCKKVVILDNLSKEE